MLATTFQEKDVNSDPLLYDYASHYDYDIAGNVKILVQDFAKLPTAHRYKTLEYDYDLLSGNVNFLFYQNGKEDNFSYHYKYDRINRLTSVYTSEYAYDPLTDEDPSALPDHWKRDAAYTYYDHGPLKRTLLGHTPLQGLDYAYTLQGWIKGVNGFPGDDFDCVAPMDMGNDGAVGSSVYRDLYRYSTQYFNNDYLPIGRATTGNPHYSLIEDPVGPNEQKYQLFNGNIFRHFKVAATDGFRTVALVARYDQLNRLTWSGNNFYDDGYASPRRTLRQ